MLAYLEQGNALYIFAALCLIGMIGKLAVNHVYKSLIKQSDNIAAAKDKQLQQMKTKYESIYRINCGIKNSEVFVQKKLAQYQLVRLRLKTWEAVDLYAGAVCLLLGIGSAFGIYWWDGNAKMSVAYLAAAAAAAVWMLLFHQAADSGGNRMLLEKSLCHYFENVLVVRSARAGKQEAEEEELQRSHPVMKDDIFMRKQEPEQESSNTFTAAAPADSSIGKSGQRAQMDALRESLSQIAAAKSEDSDKKNRRLTQKEEQLIDEILRQYLS